MLVAYPLPDKGYRYPIRRGSGLFITLKAFGDASIEVCSKSIVPRFFMFGHSIQIAKQWDVSEAQNESFMKNKILLVLAMVFSLIFVTSCTKDESEKRIEYSKIVESRTSQDLLNDLYVGSDADVEAIARIMNVTPSSIERIRKGETDPTDDFEERIHEVSIYYMQNDQSFSKLQSVLDPEYGWYDYVLNFPSHHPWWFWSINIILLLILAFAAIIAIWPILIEMLIFLIAWIASLICSPDAIQDNYVESINPTIEQVK